MSGSRNSGYRKQPRSKTMPILLGTFGVLAVAAGVLFFMLRDSGTDVSGTVPANGAAGQQSTGGTTGGPDTRVDGPASKFSPATTELPGRYTVNVPETFAQNISTFASSYLFTGNSQGADLARQWQILDGYKVQFDPDGLAAGVVQGRFGVSVEVYLFNTIEGSKAAYTYIDQVMAKTSGSIGQEAKQLANQSSAYQITNGKVAGSDLDQVYHRFIFRRGNIVAIVQTVGAQGKITVDKARDLAIVIDDRILGKRPATAPTPIPTPAFNIPPTAEPSAKP